ncbi:MAG: ParA family protein [bacterium]
MSRVISVANQKGGVGKTTTTVNLAAALAGLQQRVLLIDLDPQGNATTGCGIDKYDLENSTYEILSGEAVVRAAAQRSTDDDFDVVPSNTDLTAAEVGMISMPMKEHRLDLALKPVQDSYDYILIDCPPSLSMLTINALVASDSVLVPIQTEYYALEGVAALLNTIEQIVGQLNPRLEIEGILRTMHDPRNRLAVEVSRELIGHFEEKVFRTIIPRNVRVAEAPSHGQSVLKYDKYSRGAVSYMALASEMHRKHRQQQPSVSEVS